ncbi:MAG: class I SAM-dependent methyltransferase [Acidobacteriota bacterium]|nr:class I SAM-dependent methyltransferase [Acidobacteriota bacterium]
MKMTRGQVGRRTGGSLWTERLCGIMLQLRDEVIDMRLVFSLLMIGGFLLPLAAQETSKLNKNFLDPEMKVERFTDMFESESREIFANRERITEALALKPGMVVADVGAGTGVFMPLFSKAVGDNGQYLAVEISMRFVEHLRKRAEDEGLTNVTTVLSSLDSATLPPNSVDMVFLCDTYHHFDNPEKMLDSIKHALRPGGQLIVIDFHRIPGKSKDWLLSHMRAGQEVFRKEIEDAGFTHDAELDAGLEENYFMRFVRP